MEDSEFGEVGQPVRYRGKKLFRVACMPYLLEGVAVINLRGFTGVQQVVKKAVPIVDLTVFPSEKEIRDQCNAILEADTERGLQTRYNRARNIPSSHDDSAVEVTLADLPSDLRAHWK